MLRRPQTSTLFPYTTLFRSKTGQGFYKKTKDENGKTQILSLDLETLEYKAQKRVKFPTLDMAKPIDDLEKRTAMLIQGQDKAAEFYKMMFGGLFAYATNRVPEIADDLFRSEERRVGKECRSRW